jgi:hypothetical protein
LTTYLVVNLKKTDISSRSSELDLPIAGGQ